MAKKQSKKKPVKPAKATRLTNRVQEIKLKLKSTYALGKEALAESRLNPISTKEDESKTEVPENKPKGSVERRRRRYARHVITDLAEEKGIHFNTVETARRIAECYDEKSFRQLMRLRTPKGLPLTSNHLTHLSSIENSKQRSRFEGLALSKGWSVRRLAATINEEKIKKGHVKRSIGNKPVIPPTIPGMVQQIHQICDKWLRWSHTFRDSVQANENARNEVKKVVQKLKLLEGQVSDLRRTAGRLVRPTLKKKRQTANA